MFRRITKIFKITQFYLLGRFLHANGFFFVVPLLFWGRCECVYVCVRVCLHYVVFVPTQDTKRLTKYNTDTRITICAINAQRANTV
jgi:hypothetical protein